MQFNVVSKKVLKGYVGFVEIAGRKYAGRNA